ncbi:MAG: LD-carboxypeptidase [Bacteroidales bacterium]|nr:LD-carboxypeptidase [Bacteroidales bacterium]
MNMNSRHPDFLQVGDTIGLVAPSRKISYAELQPSIEFFEGRGFKVKLGKNIFAEQNQFAGSDCQRANDMQEMIEDDSVKAILAARGGYGAVRVIDKVNFTPLIKSPKWLCGYSDFTVFHSHLAHLNIPTIHSTMPVNICADEIEIENADSLLNALTGKLLTYSPEPSVLNRVGVALAPVVGGNLSILYSLAGSESDLDTDGKILFIEDLDEYLYHIDRMMMNLKRSGKLSRLAGLLVGDLSDMHDNTIPYGKTAEEIVSDCCAEYDFPICFNFPVGHGRVKKALRLGMELEMRSDESGRFEIVTPPCL